MSRIIPNLEEEKAQLSQTVQPSIRQKLHLIFQQSVETANIDIIILKITNEVRCPSSSYNETQEQFIKFVKLIFVSGNSCELTKVILSYSMLKSCEIYQALRKDKQCLRSAQKQPIVAHKDRSK